MTDKIVGRVLTHKDFKDTKESVERALDSVLCQHPWFDAVAKMPMASYKNLVGKLTETALAQLYVTEQVTTVSDECFVQTDPYSYKWSFYR